MGHLAFVMGFSKIGFRSGIW